MPFVELTLATLAAHKLALLASVGTAPLATLAWVRFTVPKPLTRPPRREPSSPPYASHYDVVYYRDLPRLADVCRYSHAGAMAVESITIDLKAPTPADGPGRDSCMVAQKVHGTVAFARNLRTLHISLPGRRRRTYVFPEDVHEREAIMWQAVDFCNGHGQADGPLLPVLRSIGLGIFA